MIRRVLKDCFPTVLSLMLLSTYAVIDGLFIGNFAGDIGLAAINLAWPITALIMATGVGIGIGSSILISHSRGQGDNKTSKIVLNNGLTLLLIASAILMILLYFTYPKLLVLLGAKGEVLTEASKYAKIIITGLVFQVIGSGIIPILRNFNMSFGALVCMGCATLVNITVNYILVCIVQIGIQGAAFGTIVAQLVACTIAIYLLIKKGNCSIKLRLQKEYVLKIIRTGLTGFGMSLAPSITLIFTNLQCLAYGGDSAVACYSVISYVIMPIQSMLAGVAEGSQPLMSYYVGAGDWTKLKSVERIARTTAIIMSIITSLVIYLLIPYVAIWFGLSQEGRAIFDTGMKIYTSSFLLISMTRFNICFLNAILQTKKSILLTYLESLAISPILLFLMPMMWGITGIWLSYIATGLVLFLLYFIIIKNTDILP